MDGPFEPGIAPPLAPGQLVTAAAQFTELGAQMAQLAAQIGTTAQSGAGVAQSQTQDTLEAWAQGEPQVLARLGQVLTADLAPLLAELANTEYGIYTALAPEWQMALTTPPPIGEEAMLAIRASATGAYVAAILARETQLNELIAQLQTLQGVLGQGFTGSAVAAAIGALAPAVVQTALNTPNKPAVSTLGSKSATYQSLVSQSRQLLGKIKQTIGPCQGLGYDPKTGKISEQLKSGYRDWEGVRQVGQVGANIGHDFAKHGMDSMVPVRYLSQQELDALKAQGIVPTAKGFIRVPGAFNQAHVEEFMMVEDPEMQAMAVSIPQCENCQDFSWKWAQSANYGGQYGDRFIAGPEGVRVYHTDGSIDFIPTMPTQWKSLSVSGRVLAQQWADLGNSSTVYSWSGPNALSDMQRWLSQQPWSIGRPPYTGPAL